MIQQTFRYVLVRTFGFIVHFSILALLIEVMKQDPVMSSSIGFVLTIIILYFLSYTFVFQSSNNHASAVPRFLIVALVAFCLNAGVMYLTVNVLGWWYVWGQLSAVMVVPPVNFLLNSYWTFR
jgi:putative flippase GtrA